MFARIAAVTTSLAMVGVVAVNQPLAAQIAQPAFTGLTLGPMWQDVRGGDTKSRRGWSLAGATGHRLVSHLGVVLQAGVTRFQGLEQRINAVTCIGRCPVFYTTSGTATTVNLGGGLQIFTNATGMRFFAALVPELNWLAKRDVGTGAFAPGLGVSVGSGVGVGGGVRLVLEGTARRLSPSGGGPHWIRGLSIGVVGL